MVPGEAEHSNIMQCQPYTNAEASHAENYSEQLQMIQTINFTIYYLTLITEVVDLWDMKEFLTFLGARLIGFPTLLLLPLPEILNANFLSSNTLY